MNQKLFSKDFTLVVIGQIISLFGNATIRFALPLYLLNLTGSSALYGTVTACAFTPSEACFWNGILMKISITADIKKQTMQTHKTGFKPYALY